MFTFAHPFKRLLARFIDAIFFGVLFAAEFSLLAQSNNLNHLLNSLLGFLVFLFFFPIIFSLLNCLLTSKFGGSIGKLLTGIKIVDSNGKNISFWRSFFRCFIGYPLSSLFFCLGFIWIFIDKKHQGWHDMISGTYVVSRQKNGWLIGLTSLIILIVIIIFSITQITLQIAQNIPFYQQLIQDLSSEIFNSLPSSGLTAT